MYISEKIRSWEIPVSTFRLHVACYCRAAVCGPGFAACVGFQSILESVSATGISLTVYIVFMLYHAKNRSTVFRIN